MAKLVRPNVFINGIVEKAERGASALRLNVCAGKPYAHNPIVSSFSVRIEGTEDR